MMSTRTLTAFWVFLTYFVASSHAAEFPRTTKVDELYQEGTSNAWPFTARRSADSHVFRVPALPAGTPGVAADATGGQIVQFLKGVDRGYRWMSPEEVNRELHDPMAVLLLRRGTFPNRLSSLLSTLDARNGEAAAVPDQMSFLIGEGSEIPFSSAPAT
jgi:hypothetical protein